MWTGGRSLLAGPSFHTVSSPTLHVQPDGEQNYKDTRSHEDRNECTTWESPWSILAIGISRRWTCCWRGWGHCSQSANTGDWGRLGRLGTVGLLVHAGTADDLSAGVDIAASGIRLATVVASIPVVRRITAVAELSRRGIGTGRHVAIQLVGR